MKFPEQPYVRPTAMPPGVAPRNVVIEGDCLQVLATLPDSCVDALVTDPPAAISFMNTGWDSDRGGRDAWVAWMTDVLRESLRVVKPGGYALVWSLPRTSHWTAWALEEAGWEIRDSVMHVFLQGMPKSLDAGKALDRLAGAERPVVGKAPWSQPAISGHHGGLGHPGVRFAPEGRFTPDVTSPATDDAQEWDGWGSGLKPAHETWWLARKPTDLSVAENLLTWGTGALNIDATRIGADGGSRRRREGDQRATRGRRSRVARPASTHRPLAGERGSLRSRVRWRGRGRRRGWDQCPRRLGHEQQAAPTRTGCSTGRPDGQSTGPRRRSTRRDRQARAATSCSPRPAGATGTPVSPARVRSRTTTSP
jgi:hypothetical protein